MTWARIDDTFPLHRKTRKAGPMGVALAVSGICYCSRYLTDGRIPKSELEDVWPWASIDLDGTAALLVSLDVWHDRGDHYEVHDYLDYNPTREYVLAERAKKVAAGKAGGQASAKARGQAPATAPATASASGASEPHPTPTPVPTTTKASSVRLSEPEPEDTDDARAALIRGYAARYERAANDLWQSAGKSRADITTVAAYVVASARATQRPADSICDEVLDGVFADGWMAEKRWPWAQIAKDPARYRGGNVKALPSAARHTPAQQRVFAARAAEEKARLVAEPDPERIAACLEELRQAQAALRKERSA